jgi:hypothetical protein
LVDRCSFFDVSRNNGPAETQPSGSTSKKRKRVCDDEPKLNKRPKFMVVPPKIPVIVDAGSGPDASLIQKIASALERNCAIHMRLKTN